MLYYSKILFYLTCSMSFSALDLFCRIYSNCTSKYNIYSTYTAWWKIGQENVIKYWMLQNNLKQILRAYNCEELVETIKMDILFIYFGDWMTKI
jgi:hypothetical protein